MWHNANIQGAMPKPNDLSSFFPDSRSPADLCFAQLISCQSTLPEKQHNHGSKAMHGPLDDHSPVPTGGETPILCFQGVYLYWSSHPLTGLLHAWQSSTALRLVRCPCCGWSSLETRRVARGRGWSWQPGGGNRRGLKAHVLRHQHAQSIPSGRCGRRAHPLFLSITATQSLKRVVKSFSGSVQFSKSDRSRVVSE